MFDMYDDSLSGGLVVAIVLIVIALIFAFKSINVIPQQTAWVIERLGKFHKVLNPGLNFIIPFIDKVAYKHSLKEIPLDTPSQVCITRDNTQLSVDGILYFQVTDPKLASYGTSNYIIAVTQLAQTTLRSVIGKMVLDETFEERDLINNQVVSAIDEAALNWGVKVLRYEIKDLTPPAVILQAMQRQITAEREKRAVISESEGKKQEQINLATGAREAAIAKSEQTKRKQRVKSTIPTAALVGYTNAGKSTIMNGLVRKYGAAEEKTVFEKNMLFATLDTSVRQLTLPDQKRFLLSDTVGFVSKLPTHLVESFKSTLAEAANADLLIQVIDYSDPHYKEMMETTNETLKQIGINDIPMINVFNKADKTEIEFPILEGDDQVVISAKQDASLDLLVDVIKKHLFKDYVTTTLLIPFTDGHVVSYLNEHTNILDTTYESDGTLLTVEMSVQDYQRFGKYEKN